MTTTDLKQLLAAASPGPWTVNNETERVLDATGYEVCWDAVADDNRLIALAPELAQEVLALRAERDRLREALHRISLASQNNSTTVAGLGKEARAALGEKNDG